MRYQAPSQHVAEVEGGWAQGDEIDVNGLVAREKEKERESGRSGFARAAGGGPPLSPTAWKTSHRSRESEETTGSVVSWGLRGSKVR